MSNIPFSTIAFLLLFAIGQAVEGQATRTWVSVNGNDANDCSRANPCRTLSGALAKSTAEGEIDILDSGDFGSVTIDKSISVISPSDVLGGIQTSTGNAITISAGPSDRVVLRGLTIEGLGAGLTGIKVLAAGSVQVENCTINHFTQFGIDFVPSSATATTGQLHVSNTIIRNNLGVSSGGIRIKPGANVSAIGMIENTQLRNNFLNLRVEDNSKVMVKNTTAAVSSAAGFIAVSNVVGVTLNLVDCVAIGNVNAVKADNPNAMVRIANSMLAGNTNGFVTSGGGHIVTFGDVMNADPGTATDPDIPKQ